MAIHLSPYVHTPWAEIIDEKPPAPPEGSIVGCYYNVLFPLDTDHKSYLPFDSWILSHLAGDVSSFPLSDETVGLLGKNLFETGASRQVEICFAKAIEEQLQAGTPFSLEDALKKTEEKMKPAFEAMVAELEQKEQSSKGGLSVRYKTFKEAFIKASNLKETVQWMINKIEDTTRSQTLEELTDDFIKRGGPSNLRTNQGLFRLEDRWEFRKKPVMETIASIQKYAQEAPHFFAFQEVTPEILVDLKERFSDMQWISYNNLTGENQNLSISNARYLQQRHYQN